MKKPKIIFMGTSDFAVFALKRLIKEGYDISLTVTMPDKKKGRGKKLLPTPVKIAAGVLCRFRSESATRLRKIPRLNC